MTFELSKLLFKTYCSHTKLNKETSQTRSIIGPHIREIHVEV